MTISAKFEVRSANLSDDFGKELLIKKAGNKQSTAILDGLGVFQSGKRKGQQRGVIAWIKVISGGYDRTYKKYGVVRGGCLDFRVSVNNYDEDWFENAYQIQSIKINQDLVSEYKESIEECIRVSKQIERFLAKDPNDEISLDAKESNDNIMKQNEKDLERELNVENIAVDRAINFFG